MQERLLGTDDLAERLPFSLSKIQEMAKSGQIPMIIFPGSRKYVILESAFNSWLRRTYQNGLNVLDTGQTICEGDSPGEGISSPDSSHFCLSGGKVVSKVSEGPKDRKTCHAQGQRASGALNFQGKVIQ